jgi:hypothetical protein
MSHERRTPERPLPPNAHDGRTIRDALDELPAEVLLQMMVEVVVEGRVPLPLGDDETAD